MKRILVIEDDNQMRLFLESMLAKAGYLVTTAPDGLAGVQSFRQQPADLIITDLLMPEKEGLETIADLRAEYSGIKIIAISGGSRLTQADFLAVAQMLGADRTLAKPFSRQELLEAVRALLPD
jgi:DNA-binding response OmpR family regulator